MEKEKKNNCEVFDSFTRKFTFVKCQFNILQITYPYEIVNVGNKVFFFVKKYSDDVMIYSYDVEQKVFILKNSVIAALKCLMEFIIFKLENGNPEQLILACKVSFS